MTTSDVFLRIVHAFSAHLARTIMTTFLTRVSFLLTYTLRYPHEKVHYRASRVRPRSNFVECEKLCVRKERTKETVKRKWDTGMTLCRALLRNTVPRDTFPRQESLGCHCPLYTFDAVVCRWALVRSPCLTGDHPLLLSAWRSLRLTGEHPVLLLARRPPRLTLDVRYYFPSGSLLVWLSAVRHYFWRDDLFVWPLSVRYYFRTIFWPLGVCITC